MKPQSNLIRVVGLLVVLGSMLSVQTVLAQSPGRTAGGSGGLPQGCACWAEGADCLFGETGGCSVVCASEECTCKSGSCRLGFPVAARCSCG